MSALIGHSGFVGSNLLLQRSYDALFRSSNIDDIRGRSFEHVVCAGVQAMKWWANLHPKEDMVGIQRLLDPLSGVKAARFTLISTIDVYPIPRGVDEDTVIDRSQLHAYGTHRLIVEDQIRAMFPRVAIVRLPGLFGHGLKKNVIYDLIHDNNLNKVHPGSVFQYYDVRRLADDIDRVWDQGIELLNISSEPVGVLEIRDQIFPGKVLGGTGQPPARYDMRSKHAATWEGADGYLYNKKQTLADLGNLLATVG